MHRINITCPHCNYSKDTDPKRVPQNVASITCPVCKQDFNVPSSVQEALIQPDTIELDIPMIQPDSDVREEADVDKGEECYLPFIFTGTAKEYFGIWIVNTLLKIVTLGLYSPWAKIRKRKFFYGHTHLNDVNFDYLADPMALLRGWLIGAAAFGVYFLAGQYAPSVAGIVGLVFFGAMPWVIVKSRTFSNWNSSHRNVRFRFEPAYKEAYTVFAWIPLLNPFTLGLATPYMIYRQKAFLVRNNFYGNSPFSFHAKANDFYIVFVKAIGVAIGIALIGGFASKIFFPFFVGMPMGGTEVLPVLIPLGMFLTYGFVILYGYVQIANLSWNSTKLKDHQFVSSLRVKDMAWIFVSNAVVIAMSCGLMIPWASVRLARYRVENLGLRAKGNLDSFYSRNQDEVSATGDGIGDIFGIDMGI